jgi:hypothetical protein
MEKKGAANLDLFLLNSPQNSTSGPVPLQNTSHTLNYVKFLSATDL